VNLVSRGNFSADVPVGLSAVKVHLEKQQPLKRNVSEEADRAFLRELERTDPERYHRLLKNMYRSLGDEPKPAPSVDRARCALCGLLLPDGARDGAMFCDRACRQAAYRLRKRVA
jgi:hypothetical protein